MIEKVHISDSNVIESIRANMPTANSNRNGLLSSAGSYRMVQNFRIGKNKNAIRISGIISWERVAFLLFGIHVRTRYCALISIYNTSNDENTTPYIYVDKILDTFPFKVYYKKVVGSEIELVIVQTVNSSGDSEDINVLGDNLAMSFMFDDITGYTEVTI